MGVIVALLLSLAACGKSGPTKSHEVGAAGPTLRTVADVRRSFSRQGIQLDEVPNPFAPPQPAYLDGVADSSLKLPAKPPYAAQSIPVGIDVAVYPTIHAARVGSGTVYTIGNAGPTHSYRVRNVVVHWDGHGRAPTVDAAVRALR
jgi:hypothetical protein